MENSRFLECLAADYGRTRAVVAGNLDRLVPSCPEWTVGDLVQHVGTVYLHKVATMRDGAVPAPWPPPGLNDEEPVALLDRAYAELMEEFGRRDPEEFSPTWYDPDQTVGFWIRRMAQETVIHRIDAELGADPPIAPIPDDLAIDGIDELLKIIRRLRRQEVARRLRRDPSRVPGRSYTINAADVEWLVEHLPGQLHRGRRPRHDGPATFTNADTAISGTPPPSCAGSGTGAHQVEPSAITIEATRDLTEFRRCIVIATQ